MGDFFGWIFFLWALAIGGSVGSFLNVVAYRLPRGRSLSHPPSRCPFCEHPIRWHDNVPVLGWLWLGGRCRDCRREISPRYPVVEALVASVFAGLALLEITFEAANLPSRVVPVADGAVMLPLSTTEVFYLFGLHATLMATLVAAALIEWDGHVVPRGLWIPLIVVLLFGLIFVPEARITVAPPGLLGALGWPWAVTSAAFGMVLGGVLLGSLLAILGDTARRSERWIAGALVGAAVGPVAVALLLVGTPLLMGASHLRTTRPVAMASLGTCVFLAMLTASIWGPAARAVLSG